MTLIEEGHIDHAERGEVVVDCLECRIDAGHVDHDAYVPSCPSCERKYGGE